MSHVTCYWTWIVENKPVHLQGSRRPAIPNVTPSFNVYPFHSLLEPSTHHGANTTHHNWDITIISFLLSLLLHKHRQPLLRRSRLSPPRILLATQARTITVSTDIDVFYGYLANESIGSPTFCPASSTWYETGTWGRCCPTGTGCAIWTSCSGHSHNL